MRPSLQYGLALVMGLGLALAARWILSPYFWLPEDKIWVIVNEGCGGSRIAFQELGHNEALLDRVYVLPIDDYSTEFARSVCMSTLDHLRGRASLLRLVPDSVACRWLVDDVRKLRSTMVVHQSPVFVLNKQVIPEDQEEAAFNALGMSYQPTPTSYGVAVFEER